MLLHVIIGIAWVIGCMSFVGLMSLALIYADRVMHPELHS